MKADELLVYGLHQTMFDSIYLKGDNLKAYGYSPTYDGLTHVASLKVNIPTHMTSVISSSDIEDELNMLIRTQVLIRRAIKNNPKGYLDFIKNNA